MYRGFTPDSLYTFFNTNKGYKFVRTFDESSPCTFPPDIEAIVNTDGSSYVLRGFVDKYSRKYYPWGDNVESIDENSQDLFLHLCPHSINLTKNDFPNISKKASKEFVQQDWEILGQPMPALFPYAMKQMRNKFVTNQVRYKDLYRMLN
jgi:hypothetical protein